ncbi:MAG: hypothetical protein KDD61_15515 [Bdellovibrionales bacterium]|nr:hypothetical protein [Bdellovibrionales bacterium]
MKKISHVLSLFFVSTVTVTLLVFGCSDELKEEKGDVGPEFSRESVIAAIDQARGNRNILEVKENDAVHFETSQKVEMGGPEVVLDEIYNVYHRTESEEEIKIVLTKTEITYPDGMEGKPDIVKTELDPIYIPKSDPQTVSELLQTKSVSQFYSPSEVQLLLSNKSTDNLVHPLSDNKITFHNLKIKTLLMSPPKNVREAPNCLNIPNCQFEVTQINFDLVEWSGNNWDKTNFEMILTDRVSYLTTDIQICQGAYLYSDAAQRDFYVRQCRVVRDFRF